MVRRDLESEVKLGAVALTEEPLLARRSVLKRGIPVAAMLKIWSRGNVIVTTTKRSYARLVALTCRNDFKTVGIGGMANVGLRMRIAELNVFVYASSWVF